MTVFSEFCWWTSRWLGNGSDRKGEGPVTHWLKSGGGEDGGSGDMERCRGAEVSAKEAALLEKRYLQGRRAAG